jgi:DDE superfamily endonuclease
VYLSRQLLTESIDSFLSSVVCGSTHDSLALRASCIGQKLYTTGLPSGYWVAGDAAYVCSEPVLVPFSATHLQHEDESVWRDSFNLFQSSLRVHVEQTFGMFVHRFGILWRPLEFDLPRASRIVSACALLHNYIIDNSRNTDVAEALAFATRASRGFQSLSCAVRPNVSALWKSHCQHYFQQS